MQCEKGKAKVSSAEPVPFLLRIDCLTRDQGWPAPLRFEQQDF